MELQYILYSKENGIATITLNRPEALNAWSRELAEEFLVAMKDAREDKEVKTVILTGAGEKAFSAGADIKAMQGMNAGKARDLSKMGYRICKAIESIEKPVIAAINGYALGGGMEVSMACDFRLASEHAKMGQTEINIGLIPGWGGTQRLTRIVGKAKAKELVYTGRIIDAKTAFDWGLVTRIVPKEELETAAKEFANQLASKAPVALAVAKALIEKGIETDLETALELEREGFGVVGSTEDLQEGVSAFIEKRKPTWTGK
jgi:enoyl-CoA hydratase